MSHHVLWELKRHTGAKHQILRAYLAAWFPILGSAHGRVIFVDGFAGPGEYMGGEPGSPLVALEAASVHRDRLSRRELMFLFIEEDAERHEHLEGVIAAKQAAGEIPANFPLSSTPRLVCGSRWWGTEFTRQEPARSSIRDDRSIRSQGDPL